MPSVLDGVAPLLDTYFSVTDTTQLWQITRTTSTYFEFLCAVFDRVALEDLMKTIAYFLIILSIWRLITYMSVHPRIAVLSHTVLAAGNHIYHFLIIFSFVFFALTFLACWSFGPDKDLFSTLPNAAFTQVQMILGEFPFEEPWKETTFQKGWYLLYMALIFFLAVNIFLAIIVEAFYEVQKRHSSKDKLVERSIHVDVISLVRFHLMKQAHSNWPSRMDLARHLQNYLHFQSPVSSAELKKSKFLSFQSRAEAQVFMDFYYGLLGENILAQRGRDWLQMKMQQRDTQRCLLQLFNTPAQQLESSTVKIQAWKRGLDARKKVAELRQMRQARAWQPRRTKRTHWSGELPVRRFDPWLGKTVTYEEMVHKHGAAGRHVGRSDWEKLQASAPVPLPFAKDPSVHERTSSRGTPSRVAHVPPPSVEPDIESAAHFAEKPGMLLSQCPGDSHGLSHASSGGVLSHALSGGVLSHGHSHGSRTTSQDTSDRINSLPTLLYRMVTGGKQAAEEQ